MLKKMFNNTLTKISFYMLLMLNMLQCFETQVLANPAADVNKDVSDIWDVLWAFTAAILAVLVLMGVLILIIKFVSLAKNATNAQARSQLYTDIFREFIILAIIGGFSSISALVVGSMFS